MKNVVIIGAGPAGLTAAYTLLNESSEYHPIIIEASEFIGGISRTARYNGNRIDIGGHRFFSKNKEVMKLWMDILPLQGAPSKDDKVLGRTHTFSDDPEIDPDKIDNVFLARTRLSRIYFRKRFFDYPISLKPATFINMGFVNTMKAGFGYLGSVIHKLPETSLENFYINRFGKPLYQMFFEDYTEKLWGVHPSNIAADWGAQRVKGLSVWKVITSALSKPFKKNKNNVETSLIDEFYYPKFGPGQLWERMAEIDREKGAELLMQHEVVRVNAENGSVRSVTVRCTDSGSPDFGKERTIECDFLVSSMAVKDLVQALPDVPEDILHIASELPYRDFITVGLLLDRLEIQNKTKTPTINNIVPDCWIYIQEREVKLGRLQIFNNWSPYMVDDNTKHVWVGLEYFCTEGDEMWNTPPEEFIDFASKELEQIGIIKRENIADSFTAKVKKAYPAYFGTYKEFGKVRGYLDSFDNLYCIGRNGQHRYNNMDHSMLTAMNAARHEIWYDEAQAWNIAKYNDISGIIGFMKYEGHPPLWHFVLYPFAKAGLPADILPFISWFISGVAAGLLLWKAPFRPLLKGIVLFSGSLIFYNSVMSRVYCLILLILVLLAIVYKDRNRRPVVYGLLIALLANTHLMMSGLVGILGIYMIIDLFKLWKTSSGKMNILRLAGLAIAGVGVILLIVPLLGCLSTNEGIAYKTENLNLLTVFDSLIKTLGTITAGAVLDQQLPFLSPTANWTLGACIGLVMVCAMVFFRHYRKHFIVMLVFTGVYSVICCVIWYSLPQRATLFLFTYAIIYWFALDTETPVYKEPKPLDKKTSALGKRFFSWFKGIDKQFDKAFFVLFCTYIAATIPMGSYQLIKDYFTDYSYSKITAEFVRSELPDDAVLVIEPSETTPSYKAYLPEYKFYSLSNADFWYYADHSIYEKDAVIDYNKIYNDLKNYKHLYKLYFGIESLDDNVLFERHRNDSVLIYPHDLNIEITVFDLDKEILPFISEN